jgi:hypothetical protein
MLSILVTAVIGLGQWIIYTALLWGMIKIQRMNYNFLGLIGSSLLATALGYIPVVGTYIGWVVLVICLWKCTKADIAPDVLFTVGVAGALMFCVNLFAIGWLMSNLHVVSPLLAAAYGEESDEFEMDDEFDDEESIEEKPAADKPVRIAGTPWATNASNVVRTPVASASAAVPPELYGRLTIKGISFGASQKSVLIGHGKEIHDIRPGETFSVQSEKGLTTLVCQDITASGVTLTANGAPFTLTLR